MLTERIGEAFTRPVERLVRAVAHVSPDVLTITGLALNGVACACFAFAGGKDYVMPEVLRAGGLVALVASVFDMLDGRVARLRGRETKFGAFLDSTMDRYSDMLLYMGLLILYARMERTGFMVLVWVAAFGSFMTSYARARAESLIPRCTVGLPGAPGADRADRDRRRLQPHGGGAVDHRRPRQPDRHPARRLYLRRAQEGLGARARGERPMTFDGRARTRCGGGS